MPSRQVSTSHRLQFGHGAPGAVRLQSRQGVVTQAGGNKQLEDAVASASHGGGYHSGYGHHAQFVYAKEEEECDDSINPILALGTLAVLAAAAGLSFVALTGGRRKKRALQQAGDEEDRSVLERIGDMVWGGRCNVS